jgi:hypothetical protein
VSGRFPVTIKEEYEYTPVEEGKDWTPRGAWIGLIEQKRHHLTPHEKQELINHSRFEYYMTLNGEYIDEETRCAHYNSLLTAMGKDSVLAKCRAHFKRIGRLKCEKKTKDRLNPLYTFKLRGTFSEGE